MLLRPNCRCQLWRSQQICRGHLLDTLPIILPPEQVRGFWLGPWMDEESADRQAFLAEGMRYIADGTIKLEPGALLPWQLPSSMSCSPVRFVPVMRHQSGNSSEVARAASVACRRICCRRTLDSICWRDPALPNGQTGPAVLLVELTSVSAAGVQWPDAPTFTTSTASRGSSWHHVNRDRPAAISSRADDAQQVAPGTRVQPARLAPVCISRARALIIQCARCSYQ